MIGLVSVVAVFITPVTAASPGLQDSVTAFVDVSVIPMDSQRTLSRQTVLVHGGRITTIGPAEAVTVPANAVRVDGQGKFLIPGLADMHAHVSGGARAPAMLAAFVASGVTTIRIMEGAPGTLELRTQVETGEVLGPKIYTAGWQIRSLPSPAKAVETVERYKAAGYDFIKVRNPNITPETLDSFAAAARRLGIPFGGHVPVGVTLQQWLEAGPVSAEHLDGYWQAWLKPPQGFKGRASFSQTIDSVNSGTWGTGEAELAAAAAASQRFGVWIVPTSIVFRKQRFDLSEAQHQRFMEIFDQIVRKLRDAGAGFLTGTDVGVVRGVVPGPSVHTELRLLIEAGLTPYQALEAATRNAALFFDRLDESGTIEAGKRADLVLLNGNPLQDIANMASPAGVMIGGQWLSRAELDARLTALDVPDDWR